MSKPFWICPSILAADFAKLGEEVDAILAAGADRIHFDVMDNHYVPNLSFGPFVCKALRKHGITAPIDAHLMVEPVDSLIEPFVEAGANCIVFHPEATRHVDRTIQTIKTAGIEVGVALNPASSVHLLDHVLPELNRVLLMSVNPGFGGQEFIPSTLKKAQKVRNMIEDQNLDIRIEIDGGVGVDNIADIATHGVDTFVAGSAIFNTPDYKKTISDMRQALAI